MTGRPHRFCESQTGQVLLVGEVLRLPSCAHLGIGGIPGRICAQSTTEQTSTCAYRSGNPRHLRSPQKSVLELWYAPLYVHLDQHLCSVPIKRELGDKPP